MSGDFSKELGAAKDIARQAGEIMLQYFETDADKETAQKEDNSPVTIADKKINHLVIEELGKYFDDGIVGEEESTAEYGSGRRWICDPIDGTKAFVVGVPTAMFSLGLVEDGTPILGVAYDPFLEKLYWGLSGGGSYCNDTQLHVSQKDITSGYVAITSTPKRTLQYKDCIDYLGSCRAELIAFSGSVYKMCMVARGSLIGYLEAGINPHDTVAGEIIVEEAGGSVTDFKGNKLDYTKKFKGAIFSNTLVHEELLRSLKGIELKMEE